MKSLRVLSKYLFLAFGLFLISGCGTISERNPF